MNKSDNTGFRRVLRAAVYSAQGFAHAWRYEAAFRQELVLAVLLLPVAVWLGQNALQRVLLIASCLLVLIVELLNSAIETTVDRFGSELNELSGRAKDLGSAAVFTSLVLVLVIWGGIAWQRFAG